MTRARKKPGPKPWSRRRHGTRSCYVLGCRQPECVAANRLYQRKRNRELVLGR